MQFALFYEIPVPGPWGPDSEHSAYKNVLAQAVAGERFGWDAFWTVEHHFLSEFSHCSNPEVLYGAVAALTERIRIGYGVRLMPQPYNHPVRTAESVAVLDLLSDGRVDLGTGPLLDEGRARRVRRRPGRDPRHVAGGHRARGGVLDQRRVRVRRQVLADAQAAGAPQAAAEARTRPSGAPPAARTGTARWARWAWACARSPSGSRPQEVKAKVDIYREAVANCTKPIGAFVNNQAATFTMALCAPDRRPRHDSPASPSSGTRRPAPGTSPR